MEQMEAGRRLLYKDAGTPLEGWVEKGLFIVVAGLNVEFLREIKELDISFFAERSWVEDKRFFLEHGLALSSGKPAVKVVGSFAFLSAELKRSIIPPGEFSDSINAILAK
jgi:acyl-CoA thioesterase FadM